MIPRNTQNFRASLAFGRKTWHNKPVRKSVFTPFVSWNAKWYRSSSAGGTGRRYRMEYHDRNRKWLIFVLAAAIAVIICGSAPAEQDVTINKKNFPDENFRDVVGDFDLNSDHVLSAGELATVTYIDCYDREISNMKGIEYFTALKTLICTSNKLTGLDVSRNTELIELQCDMNYLESLDVSYNPALQALVCSYNELQNLDLSNNTDLQTLICDDNQLETLNVSRNTALERLLCDGNMLTKLDIRKNTELKELDCSYNALTTLNISKNKKINHLFCYRNQLTELNLINQPDLVQAVEEGTKNEIDINAYHYSGAHGTLSVDQTVLLITGIPVSEDRFPDSVFRYYIETSIDTNGDKMLSNHEIGAVTSICLYAEMDGENYFKYVSSLKGIELFSALEELNCSHCRLTTLDLSANTELQEVNCSYNQLTSLKLSANKVLRKLNCSMNQLTVLNPSANTALGWMDCAFNDLTVLDVSKNQIETLICSDNQLTSLKIGENDFLDYLDCKYNRLKSVDVSGAPKILDILFYGTDTSEPHQDYKYYFLSSTGSFYVDADVDVFIKTIPNDCIRIPASVTSIGSEAFRGSGATSFFVPKGVTFIGEKAFPSGVTIYGKIGYVQYWCRENGYYFVPALH